MTTGDVTICAVDVGTTLVKATLRRGASAPLARTAVRFPDQPLPGQADIHGAVWQAFAAAVREVSRAGDPEVIVVSAQMAGLAMLDHHGRPVGPLLPGVTAKAPRVVPDVSASGSAESEVTTVAKYLWWMSHRPAVAPACIGGVKEYLLHRLTGRWVTDPASASASGFYDITARGWSESLLDQIGVPLDALPAVVDMEQVVGVLDCSAAAECGVATGTEVLCGLGDGPAANLSSGATRPGILCFSRGTTLVARVLTDSVAPFDVGLPLFAHHVHGSWTCSGVRFVPGGTGCFIPTGAPGLRLDLPAVFEYLRPLLVAAGVREIRPVGGTPVSFPGDWPVREVPADRQDGTLGMTKIAAGWSLEHQQGEP